MDNYLQEDKWLSEVLERQVFKLSADEGWLDHYRDKKNEKQFRLWQESLPELSLIYAKIPVLAVQTARILQKLDFFLVDTQVTLEKGVIFQSTLSSSKVKVRFAQASDEDDVCSLAQTSFHYSRFHLDPLIPRRLADRVKAEWVANYFRGQRGDALVVALYEDKVVGFLQLIFSPTKEDLLIDLIAVDERLRGKGIAAAMINYAEQSCPLHERMAVGTQVANIPSVRLYEKLGFRLRSAHYVYHYHQPSQRR